MTELQMPQNDILSRVQRQNQRDSAAIAEALNVAQENPQPFMSTNDEGKPVIVGDVTRVDEPEDYIVAFEYPKDLALKMNVDNNAEDLGNGWVRIERLFREVQITSMMAFRLKNAAAILWEYMLSFNNNRQLEILTVGDAYSIFKEIPDDFVSAMERIVQVSLDISDVDMKYIEANSLINTASQLIVNNAGFFQRDIESAPKNN